MRLVGGPHIAVDIFDDVNYNHFIEVTPESSWKQNPYVIFEIVEYQSKLWYD